MAPFVVFWALIILAFLVTYTVLFGFAALMVLAFVWRRNVKDLAALFANDDWPELDFDTQFVDTV